MHPVAKKRINAPSQNKCKDTTAGDSLVVFPQKKIYIYIRRQMQQRVTNANPK
jgi:hypothetical protein